MKYTLTHEGGPLPRSHISLTEESHGIEVEMRIPRHRMDDPQLYIQSIDFEKLFRDMTLRELAQLQDFLTARIQLVQKVLTDYVQ